VRWSTFACSRADARIVWLAGQMRPHRSGNSTFAMKNLFSFGKSKSNPIVDATRRLERNPRDVLALIDRASAYLAQHNAAAAQQDIERGLQVAILEPSLTGDARSRLLARLYTILS